MTKNTYQPQVEDFAPATQYQEAQGISRPSLSYWQDAWRRLRANTRAMVSGYIILALLFFTIAGPYIWTVDPAFQDLDQVSQPPNIDRKAILVEPNPSWDGNADSLTATHTQALYLAQAANTESVRLVWDVQPGAGGYRLYRNIFPQETGQSLGLPLFTTFDPEKRTFEDLLDLTPRTFYYTLVLLDNAGQETSEFVNLNVQVQRVLTIEQAIAKGLLESADQAKPGDIVYLKLHPMGTDYLGRDMLARLMYGARVSLFIGIFAPLLFVSFGVLYGSTAGFVGGLSDQMLMRFSDFVVALPFLLFMILFKIAFGIGPGESGVMPMLIAMVVLSWPSTARLVRGQILQIREEGYIAASRLLGAKSNYLILRHMIPNTMGVILVTMTFAVPSAIFTEAFLSFIGMGVAPPTPSWGSMCFEGIKTMLTHPHELIFPALLISITVLAFNLLGDGLRDALDAKMRSKE